MASLSDELSQVTSLTAWNARGMILTDSEIVIFSLLLVQIVHTIKRKSEHESGSSVFISVSMSYSVFILKW